MPRRSADTLTLGEINRATLARQMLLERERLTPLAAIERLVALQAQWPRPPYVALWTRLHAFERTQLDRLFAERRVVRGTFLRATIHVVSSADFVKFRPVIQPALEASMQAILKERLKGLDVDALTARVARALERRPQTFEEIRDGFLRADPDADERAMGYAVRMRLPLLQVPEPGAAWGFSPRARFAPAAQWLGRPISSKAADPDDLLLRYLAAYGPASVRDFQAWAGLAPAAAREAFARVAPKLRRFQDEQKKELFDLPDAPRPGADVPAPIRFVPEYDNLITTRADERFVKRTDRPRVFLSALRIAATVLVDGFVAATWTLKATKKAARVDVQPFGALSRRVRAGIEAEGDALARFMEPGAGTIEVRFGG